MFRSLQQIGHFFRTVQGWVGVLSALPTVGAAVMAFLEDQPWSGIIFISTATLAYMLAAIYCFIGTMDYVKGKLTKNRIIRGLQSYQNSGYVNIDLPTAAAMWANTRDDQSIERHISFRKLKAAVDTKKLASVGNVANANIKTHVPISELVKFFENDEVYK